MNSNVKDVLENVTRILNDYDQLETDWGEMLDAKIKLGNELDEQKQVHENLRQEFDEIRVSIKSNDIVALIFEKLLQPMAEALAEVSQKYLELKEANEAYSKYATETSAAQAEKIVDLLALTDNQADTILELHEQLEGYEASGPDLDWSSSSAHC